jgi:hypothetical protein
MGLQIAITLATVVMDAAAEAAHGKVQDAEFGNLCILAESILKNDKLCE